MPSERFETGLPASSSALAILRKIANRLRPPPSRGPAEWAAEERVLPPSAGEPGPFNAWRTPYFIPMYHEIHVGRYPSVVAVCSSQTGKSDMFVNCMGHRLHDDPIPILYIAPTKNFIESTWEPRFREMVRGCRTLWNRMTKGKGETKTRKIIGGVKVRFAWAGSATELAGEPAGKVYIDEFDRCAPVKGEGDVKTLGDARHSTYPDGQTIVVSTPLEGSVDTEQDEWAGLERWAVSDLVTSPTWRLWQQGTRHEWAWPCPDCGEYFIPRKHLLWWPKEATPAEARRHCRLTCPHCGSQIDEVHKDEMNARGEAVAPGERIGKNGKKEGEPPETNTWSIWVSGLASPFTSWGELVEKWIKAQESGDLETIRGIMNTGFGELYFEEGERPKKAELEVLIAPYQINHPPETIDTITCGVDVQAHSLYYAIRGWGENMESWLIDEHEITTGSTAEDQIWLDLELLREKTWNGIPIRRMFIDSGFRPDRVYAFCRRHAGWAFPTKGRKTMERPLRQSQLDVGKSGRPMKAGMRIWHIDTDFFKRWTQDRLRRDPELPGGYHLPEDVTDDYLRQMVSESRITTRAGAVEWVKHDENHLFDCEVLNVAAAYSLQLQLRQSGSRRRPSGPSREERHESAQGGRARKPFTGRNDFSDWLKK